MTWSYDARINHEVKAAFIEEVRLHKTLLLRSSNFDIHNCAQELVHNASTLENTCASIRRFAGSLMAFDELLEDFYKYRVSSLFKGTNWACHGKYEKHVGGRVSQPLVHTTITLPKLAFIKNTLNSIVMYLARHNQLVVQSGDKRIEVQSRESVDTTGSSSRSYLGSNIAYIWEVVDDTEPYEDWKMQDCAAKLKWYKRVWYWFRTWVCFGWQSF
jgi:hypothetical protein